VKDLLRREEEKKMVEQKKEAEKKRKTIVSYDRYNISEETFWKDRLKDVGE